MLLAGATSMRGNRGWLSQQFACIPQNSTDFIVVMIRTNDCNFNYLVRDVDAICRSSYPVLKMKVESQRLHFLFIKYTVSVGS